MTKAEARALRRDIRRRRTARRQHTLGMTPHPRSITMSTTTVHFYVPVRLPEYQDRTDQRVRLLDHDEVSLTTRVEFPDGFRLVVRDEDIVSRKVES